MIWSSYRKRACSHFEESSTENLKIIVVARADRAKVVAILVTISVETSTVVERACFRHFCNRFVTTSKKV